MSTRGSQVLRVHVSREGVQAQPIQLQIYPEYNNWQSTTETLIWIVKLNPSDTTIKQKRLEPP